MGGYTRGARVSPATGPAAKRPLVPIERATTSSGSDAEVSFSPIVRDSNFDDAWRLTGYPCVLDSGIHVDLEGIGERIYLYDCDRPSRSIDRAIARFLAIRSVPGTPTCCGSNANTCQRDVRTPLYDSLNSLRLCDNFQLLDSCFTYR
jgi:hypothetical protein